MSEILGDAIVCFEDLSLEEIVGKQLNELGKTVATAESCTGGEIASKITSVPGSSNYFVGSVVAYSNEIKKRVLNVSVDLLTEFGAVSKEVVEAMAIGARQLLQSDYAIATSGIAGPGGGTLEKPVGTVWIAVACEHRVVSCVFRFGSSRKQNMERTTQEAFLMLKELL